MKRLIAKLAKDFPNSDHMMCVEDFASWMGKQSLEDLAPDGVKVCSGCGDHRLVNFRTIQHPSFSKPGYRHCSGCGLDMAWHLDEGQPALLGSHRAIPKQVKSDV